MEKLKIYVDSAHAFVGCILILQKYKIKCDGKRTVIFVIKACYLSWGRCHANATFRTDFGKNWAQSRAAIQFLRKFTRHDMKVKIIISSSNFLCLYTDMYTPRYLFTVIYLETETEKNVPSRNAFSDLSVHLSLWASHPLPGSFYVWCSQCKSMLLHKMCILLDAFIFR